MTSSCGIKFIQAAGVDHDENRFYRRRGWNRALPMSAGGSGSTPTETGMDTRPSVASRLHLPRRAGRAGGTAPSQRRGRVGFHPDRFTV